MGDCAKTFDDGFARQNPPLYRFDPTQVDQSILEYEILRSSKIRMQALLLDTIAAREPNPPTLHFDYLDDPTVNAWAFFDERENCGCIGMTIGAVWLIHDLFYRMLSLPNILATIGNVSAESIRHPYCTEGLWENYKQLLLSRRPDGGSMANVLPRDPDRKAYAELLAAHALDFLILHELAHIADGHCQYATTQQRSLIAELSAKSSGGTLDPITSQGMEMAADAIAVLATWEKRLNNTSDSDKMKRALLEKGNDPVIASELLMFDWMFSAFAMFWLFGQSIDPDEIDSSDHPPPPQRATMAFARINSFLEKRPSRDIEMVAKFDRTWPKARNAVVVALAEISAGGLLEKFEAYGDFERSGISLQHASRVVAHWKTVVNDIRKFSHPGLFPLSFKP